MKTITVTVTAKDQTVTVGAGVTLDDLYGELAGHGRTIAAGCGPTVGIAGLALGGGLGILGRLHGLTSDQLTAAEVVLADGRTVWCDEHRHTDLFWALRGAGGCRFGVVTKLVFRTIPAPDTTTFDLRWPHSAASRVIGVWQDWAPDAVEEIAASLLVTAGPEPDRPVAVRVFGAMVDSEPATRRTLDDLVTRIGADPALVVVEHLPYRQAKRALAEADTAADAGSEPGRIFNKSEFFRRSLPAATVTALVEHIGQQRTPGQVRQLDFTPWGGAYNRVRPSATAFVHRSERFLLKHEVVVDTHAARDAVPAGQEWLARSWALMHPWGSGGVYPNFPDPDLDAWDQAYHGTNRDRLLRAKATYDPDALFP